MEILGLTFAALGLVLVLVVVVPATLVWIAIRVVGLVFRVLGLREPSSRAAGPGRVARWTRDTLQDAGNLLGNLVGAVSLGVFSLTQLLLLRTAAFRRLGSAAGSEALAAAGAIYRLLLGHPLRLLGLGGLVRSLEQRIPAALDAAYEAERRSVPTTRGGALPSVEGYQLERELVAGGSGARIFVGRPTPERVRDLGSRGRRLPEQVVVKVFTLTAGSTLPQILRESRALEPAGRLGLVLDHCLDEEQFHYVMPFVEGPSLQDEIDTLHQGDTPLDGEALRRAVAHAREVCDELQRFHGEGLWHKDVKPANLIVSSEGVRLVDLGLVTPLASALTLTTHGTEYYRDPELVRLALRGTRVNQVDGVKFDLYGAGAVLFALLEGTFPANGSLTPFEKQSPEALRFVVRRAMADLESRYANAAEMAHDLEALLAAEDLASFKPMQLPSMGGPLPTRGAQEADTAQAARRVPAPEWRTVQGPGGSETGPSTQAARDLGWRDMGEDPRQRRQRRRTRRAVGAALITVVLATLAMHGLRFLLGAEPEAPRRMHFAPLEDAWLPVLDGVRAERGLLVLGCSLPEGLEEDLLARLPDLRLWTEADLPPAGQAALRLALEVSQAQGEGPHSEEVRRALWDHAPGPVDLLLLEPSALDREVLVPRLILGP
ncbi:MAG: hypothetical protein ISQ08_02430 [Planctomycetes bacterium]|nr:hypothetical protein [Planctomycetota bacterium]